jgi:hypothetical protein
VNIVRKRRPTGIKVMQRDDYNKYMRLYKHLGDKKHRK